MIKGKMIVLCLIFSGCILTITYAKDQTYTVGVVPQFDARKIQRIWQPILKAVSKSSGVRLKLKGSPNIPKFEKEFNTGKFDFAYMNPYHLIVADKYQGYEPLVRDVGCKLFGVLVVRKDSPIKRVEDLDGKTIAFPSPNALGAALIPRAEFSRKFKINVNPRYVKSHSSVYLNVVLGQTDAGGGVQKTFEQQSSKIKDSLRIFYQTAKVAPHPIAVHPRVGKADREKVINAFLKLGTTDKGKAMLAKVPIKRIGKATMSDYDPLRAMKLEEFYVKEK